VSTTASLINVLNGDMNMELAGQLLQTASKRLKSIHAAENGIVKCFGKVTMTVTLMRIGWDRHVARRRGIKSVDRCEGTRLFGSSKV
jgi:hypothetical protein